MSDADFRAVLALRQASEYASRRMQRVVNDPIVARLLEENHRLREIICADGAPLRTRDFNPDTGQTGIQEAVGLTRVTARTLLRGHG